MTFQEGSIVFDECRISNSNGFVDDGFNLFIRSSFCLPHDMNIEAITQRCLCRRCSKYPSTTWYSSVNSVNIIRCECDSCSIYWNVCLKCPNNMCLYAFSPVSHKLRRNKRNDTLEEQITSHLNTCNCHLHLRINNGYEPEFDTNLDSSFFQDDVEAPSENATESFRSMLDEMFPDADTDAQMNVLKEALFHRETTKRYAEHNILKSWMKTDGCNLSKDDVQLFLRLVQIMNLSGRDELSDLAFVIDALCKKKELERKRMSDEMCRLTKLLNESKLALQSLHQTLTSHNVTSNVDFQELFGAMDTEGVGFEETISLQTIDVPMPRSVAAMRQILEAKHGFLASCVIPYIHLHTSGCAYVLPSEVLRIAICTGVPIEIIEGPNYSTETLHPRSVYRSLSIKNKIMSSSVGLDAITIAIGYWSDGCICGTDSKGGRNSAKTITIHIAHPQMTTRHVFPICFGRKDADDSEVIQLILEDLETLNMEPMRCYVPKLKKITDVHILLAYALQDRPEHSETTSFMSSGGTFSKRVGVSCPVVIKRTQFGQTSNNISHNESESSVICEKQLASCSNCHSNRIMKFCRGEYQSASRSSQRCAHCYDWDMLSLMYKPIKGFPPDQLPQEAQNIENYEDIGYVMKAKQVSFESMKTACDIIFLKVLNKDWKLKEVEQFSRTECIRHDTWRKVYDRAILLRNTPTLIDVQLPSDVLPPFWNQGLLKMDDIHLGVMHYLFLNVGSHLIMCIREKLKGTPWTHVYNLWNSILCDIRSMSLSWCKCWTLGSKEIPASMWVSENYVGFSMVCKTLSLSIRSLSNLVEDTLLIEDACNAYYCLVSYIMSPTEPTRESITIVNAMSKIFLTSIVQLDNSIYKDKEDNKVQSASCFVNLLNVGFKMEQFGIIRNYWEGGYKGEKIFLGMKSVIKRGLHNPGVAKSILRKLYQAQSIEEMISNNLDEDSYVSYVDAQASTEVTDNVMADSTLFDVDRYRKFHAYKDIEDVNDKLNEKRPLAVMRYENRTSDSYVLYVLLGHRQRTKKVVRLDLEDQTNYFNTKTFNISIDGDIMDIDQLSNDSKDFVSCLLLPLFQKVVQHLDGERSLVVVKKYYLISEDHEECGRGLRFNIPLMHERENEDTIQVDDVSQNIMNRLSQAEIVFCSTYESCISLKDRTTEPKDGCEIGIVTKFRYKQGIQVPSHAYWTVSYYENSDNRRRAKMNEEIDYIQLKAILCDTDNV